jgi:tRNA(Ile)-lysidine synthase
VLTRTPRSIFSSFDLSGSDTIVIALSGGGDSMALLRLAHAHFLGLDAISRLVAVTVDHGLRPQSAAEAERAGYSCAQLGIRHVTRIWHGTKPSRSLLKAARDTRYALLADAARDMGARIVMTGHTLDDQIETVAMRRQRGKGRGLAGIPPATLHDGSLWFARPLLESRRDDLRAYLSQIGQDWSDDPSNDDSRFERVRIRKAIAAGADAPLPEEIARANGERIAASEIAAAAIADEALWQFGEAPQSAELAVGVPMPEGFVAALAVVMSWVGNSAHLPAQSQLDRAAEFCLSARQRARLTLNGCLMVKAEPVVRITPEARNRRTRGFGFDHLLPSPDFAVAQALAGRTGRELYPAPPLK